MTPTSPRVSRTPRILLLAVLALAPLLASAPPASAIACVSLDANLDSMTVVLHANQRRVDVAWDPNVDCWPVGFDEPVARSVGA